MPTVSPATLQRVYVYYRDYRAAEGYAPNNGEAAAALGLSDVHVRRAVRWLADLRFVTYIPAKQRTVRITPRECAQCGEEIVPSTAVLTQDGDKTYVRRKCYTCYRLQQGERQREYRDENRPMFRRLWAKLRKRNRATINKSQRERRAARRDQTAA